MYWIGTCGHRDGYREQHVDTNHEHRSHEYHKYHKYHKSCQDTGFIFMLSNVNLPSNSAK